MTARRFVLVLTTIIGLGGTGIAAPGPSASAARPVAITGRVNADAGIFIPVAQHGSCKVVLFHPGDHLLTGALEGQIIEDGTLVIDRCTGDGFYNVTAAFTGTVLGSEPGTATFTAQGRLRNFAFIDKGHFALDRGEGGLAGVHAVGTFEFTLGIGGDYVGLAHFDDRSE
jgi:hypothetical protein